MSAGGMNQYLSPIVNIDFVGDAFGNLHFIYQASGSGHSFNSHVGTAGRSAVRPLYTTKVRISSISLDKEVGLIRINVRDNGMSATALDNLGRLDGRLKYAMQKSPLRSANFSPRVWSGKTGGVWTIKCYPAKSQLYTGVGRDIVHYDPQTADEHLGRYLTRGRYVNICFSVQKPWILPGATPTELLVGNRIQVEALHFTEEIDDSVALIEPASLQNVWDNTNQEIENAAADRTD